MKEVNWAIMAPGNIATKFATALKGVESAKLYSVASRNPRKAAEFANQFTFEKSAASYADLVADPKVDVVYIASPHSLHAEQSILCLQAGKAVLCEKPMTVNTPEAEAVFSLAKKKHLFFMEAVWTRFMPTLQKVRSWIEEGRIGQVEMVQANFGFCFPFEASHRLYDKALAGGALLDLGIYPITFAQWVMQQAPNDISAIGQIGQSGVDEKNAVLLHYPSGGIAVLNSSITTETSNEAWIFGSKGKIKIPQFWQCQQATLFERKNRGFEGKNRDNNEITSLFEAPHRINGYEYEIEEVHRCLSERLIESPIMPWDQSITTMQIMDEVRQQIGVRYSVDT